MMDEKLDEINRSLVAAVTAHEFLIDHVLRTLFLELPKHLRLDVAESLLDASARTEQFHGISKDDFQAERLADMVIQTQQRIDAMIGRALEASEKAEELAASKERKA
jgi:hypothetical protein